MKKLRITIILLSLCIVSCVLAACVKPKEEAKPLNAPYNFHMQGKILVWANIENSIGYVIDVDGVEHQIQTNYYSLANLTKEGSYNIKVLAVGDGERFLSSTYATYIYVVECENGSSGNITTPLDPTPNLEYTLLEDGSGYEVSKGTAILSGTVVIPDYYKGLPVKRIANGGFALYSAPLEHMPNKVTTAIKLPSTLEEIGSLAFYMYQSIKKIEIPSSVKIIDTAAFEENVMLSDIVLPDTLESIGDSAFSGCYSLKEIVLPDGIQSVGFACLNKTAWMDAQPDGYLINNGVLLGYKGAIEKDIVIPKVRLIANMAFQLTEIVSVTIQGCEKIGDFVFFSCLSLNKVILPNDLKVISYGAFIYCKSLTEINLPEGITEIGKSVFKNCSSLIEVELPSSLKKMGEYAFYLSGIKKLEIPEGITDIVGLWGCKNLEEITIPISLVHAIEEIFALDTQLKTINFKGTKEQWEQNIPEDFVLPDGVTLNFLA